MLTCIISAIILTLPPAITSEEEWTAPGVTITEEWSLNVTDRIDPAYIHLGDVYGVESEDGFHWHTILVAEDYVLHFEDDTVIDSLRYDGDIDFIAFSPNHRYLLGYSGLDQTIKLFDFDERTVKYELVFSYDMELTGSPFFYLTNDGKIIAKHSTYLRIYDSDFNVLLSKDDFEWGGSFIGMTDDGSRMYSSDDLTIRAYNENADEVWSIDLPESDGEVAWRHYALSNSGDLIAIADNFVLYIYDAISGNKISELRFETSIINPEFSNNDQYLVVDQNTYPGTTPLRPADGFGLVLLSVNEGSLEMISEFYCSQSNENLPTGFSNYRISNTGNIIGFLYYAPGKNRIAMFLSDYKLLWTSPQTLNYPGHWFIEQQQGISPDGAKIWYFDGSRLHSCELRGE